MTTLRHLLVLVSAGVFLSTATAIGAGQPPRRPNIIIVLVDDMGFSDVGCYGGEIETPNIDRLAAGGLRFTQFYNAGRCCPTRASLITGLHPHQVGIGHMTEPPGQPLGFKGAYQGYLNRNCATLAEVLRTAGYHTLMAGKWHLGVHGKELWPLQRGFDRFYGCLSGAINYFKPGGNRGITHGNEPVTTDKSFYATDTFTDYACTFIEEATKKENKPFFLYLAYNAPHWPLNSKWDEFMKYKGTYKNGWEALMRNRLAKQKAMGLVKKDIVPAPHVGPQWDSLSEKKRDDLDSIMAAYAGCIDSIDQNIGKLTRFLERTGKLENTIIFFLSDNGACQEGGRLGKGSLAMVKNPPLETTGGVRLGLAWANACNTPFRLYKHFVHEGGACTPMIASWPAGIPKRLAGSFVREHAYLPDFMATCIELAGAAYPERLPPCEGASMVPLLGEPRKPIHTKPIFWEHEGNAAVRWGKWKLVREYEKPWELYDLATDRAEMRNLSRTNAQKTKEMVDLWTTWARKNKVAFPERFNMYEFLNRKSKKNKKVSLVPTAPCTAPNYWCTWYWQNYRIGHGKPVTAPDAQKIYTNPAAREELNEEILLGEKGWARVILPRTRSDYWFLIDHGWQDTSIKRNTFFSLVMDPRDFPSYAALEPKKRIKKLTEAITALGWRGLGLWVRGTPTEAEARRFVEWSKYAGVEYWKIDGGDTKNFWSLKAKQALYPELVLEYVTGSGGPLNRHWDDPNRGEYPSVYAPGKASRALRVMEKTDVFRTYDAAPLLVTSVTMQRVHDILSQTAGTPAYRALLNVQDDCAVAAALGCVVAVKRHPMKGARMYQGRDLHFQIAGDRHVEKRLNEMDRFVRWQRIAAPMPAGYGTYQASERLLLNKFTFRPGDTWLKPSIGKLVHASAPAVMARNIPLPEVVIEGDAPHVMAGRFPNGAICVATEGRVKPDNSWYHPRAAVTLKIDDGKEPVGVFGHYASLTLVLDQPIPTSATVWAQDLLADGARNVTEQVQIQGNRLTLPGTLIDRVGTAAGTEGDISAPGLVLSIR